MAGYIGSKASVTQVDGYNRTEADAEFVQDPNGAITVSGSNVGIGTSLPERTFHVNSGNTNAIAVFESTDSFGVVYLADSGSSNNAQVGIGALADDMILNAGGATAMRIDSSGNVLVGNTSFDHGSTGGLIAANGRVYSTVDGNFCFTANRLSSDGEIMRIQRSGTTVGSIGVWNNDNISLYGNSSHAGIGMATNSVEPLRNNVPADNSVDLGVASARWDDIFATNGTIQTSDRNEKQDIEALNDAETAVAVSCKGLLRKFRWIDAVAEKGDDARIHFGIIAQDLQDAFAAEGLDAGRYAMFISSTWWETQTDVPAVEAVDEVLDEDGNVVTEAVEAKEAYTRTDTYETLEEAPEGATECTRLGVRYPELLAFIIGAM